MLGYRPRVFVSYAHDSPTHKDDVLKLAKALRDSGADVHLDQEFTARQDWFLWALRQIQDADFVIVVASPAYRLRAEGRAASDEGRGSQAEAAILRDKLTEDWATWTRKILPVVLPGASVADIPGFLQPYSATHYLVGAPTRAGIAELLAAMAVPPGPAGDTRSGFGGRKARRLAVPVLVFAVVVAVVVLVVATQWSGDPENEWHAVMRGNGVSLVPATFACTSGVEDKIDLDTGKRGHGVQPQIPYSSCVSEGGLADLIVDDGQLHSASEHRDTILLVPPGENPDGARCHAMITSEDAALTHALPLGSLRAGDQLCVRTDKGRVALVTIRKIAAGSHLVIDFVVWQKP